MIEAGRAEQRVAPTCEGEDGTVGPAPRQEVGHVAAAGVDKDGARVEVVGHLCRARAQLLAHAPVQPVRQLRQHNLPVLLLPAPPSPCSIFLPRIPDQHVDKEIASILIQPSSVQLFVNSASCQT